MAIALLKEQQETISSFQGTICKLNAALEEQAEIVRCKDCKNAEILPWLDNAIICKKHTYTGVRPDEFYCADGKRR